MTNAPTYQYYADGTWRNAESGELFDVKEPYSGIVVEDAVDDDRGASGRIVHDVACGVGGFIEEALYSGFRLGSVS